MKRRDWLRWGCAHCATFSGLALAQQTPDATAGWSVPPRFTAPDLATDEGGLWAMMEREERRLRRSPFRLRDDALGDYLTGIACRLGGTHCPDVRVYAIRAALFNATMAPNGMLQIWSGMLLRVDNEAQLAAIIGHEIGHYLQRHTLERLRDLKARAAFGQFLGLFGLVGLVGQVATLASAMAFSRDQEREADRIGVTLMRQHGYDTREAGRIWANLLDELRANPEYEANQDSVLFATHPPSDERRAALDALTLGSEGGRTGADAFQARLAPHRFGLLQDELKRGRPHETVALLDRLLGRAQDDAELLYVRGEALRLRALAGDEERAFGDLQAAARSGREPALTHRALGELHRASGRHDDARAAWTRYLERAPDAPDAGLIRQSLDSTGKP